MGRHSRVGASSLLRRANPIATVKIRRNRRSAFMIKNIYLAGGVRTAIGSLYSAFVTVPAPALGSAVVKEALKRSGVAPDEVDEVIYGNVVGTGLGQNVARQVSLGARLSPTVGATTVNKVCGSGL